MSETVEFNIERLSKNTVRTSNSILNKFFEYLSEDGCKFVNFHLMILSNIKRKTEGRMRSLKFRDGLGPEIT